MSAIARTTRPAAAAVSFLTCIPVGARVDCRAADVARGSLFFPLVGAGIGGLAWLVATGLDNFLGVFLAATVAIAAEATLTGGIHFDGLADAADALGARSRERALEIMRDGSIGAFGALALVLDVLLKLGAIAALVQGPDSLKALVAAYAAGRAAPIALAWWLPYARSGVGSGRALTDAPAWPKAGALVLASGIVFAALGLEGAVVIASASLCVLGVGLLAARRLQGVTGDVLGAATELATTGALLAALAVG